MTKQKTLKEKRKFFLSERYTKFLPFWEYNSG